MKVESISRILEAVPGVRAEGATWTIPEELELSVYLAMPSEMITIARVAKISSGADVLTIETVKGERFFFPPEFVAGLKAGHIEPRGPRSTGFR